MKSIKNICEKVRRSNIVGSTRNSFPKTGGVIDECISDIKEKRTYLSYDRQKHN